MGEREFVEKEVCDKTHEGLNRLCDERHTKIDDNFGILFKKLDLQSMFLVIITIIGVAVPIIMSFVK